MATVTKKMLAATEAAVLAGLDALVQNLDYNEAASRCLEHLSRAVSASVEDKLAAVFSGLWFLENHARHGLGTAKNLASTATYCETVLRQSGAQPGSRLFADLYGRIYASLSDANLRAGDPWLALWQACEGDRLASGGASGAPERAFAAATVAYSRRRMVEAAAKFFVAEVGFHRRTDQADARLGRIRALRLLGNLEEAQLLAGAAVSEYADLPRQATEFLWQEHLASALRSRRAAPLFAAWDSDDALFAGDRALLAALTAYSTGYTPLKQVRRAATLRSKFAGDLTKSSHGGVLLRMLQAIEDCRDSKHELAGRLRNIGLFTAKHRGEWGAEEELIFLATLARWLHEQRQRPFLLLVLHEASALSMALSEGKNPDVFGLFGDFQGAAADVPTANAQRLLRFSRLAAEAGAVAAAQKETLTAAGRSARQVSKAAVPAAPDAGEVISQTVALVIAEIGSCKGPMTKLGHLLVDASGLPSPLRSDVAQASATAAQLPSNPFASVLAVELGLPPKELFRWWQPEPIGIGSIGQVFKAELLDGTPVAVKIASSALPQLLRHDLQILHLALPVLRSFFPALDGNTLLANLTAVYLSECDLRVEAARAEQLRAYFGARPGVTIPRIYPQFTSRSVLVMDYVDGQGPDDASESVTVRTAVRPIYRETLAALNLWQYDPRGGDAIVSGEGLALVDFGSLWPVAPRTAQRMLAAETAILAGDGKGLSALAHLVGMLLPEAVRRPGLVDFFLWCLDDGRP